MSRNRRGGRAIFEQFGNCSRCWTIFLTSWALLLGIYLIKHRSVTQAPEPPQDYLDEHRLFPTSFRDAVEPLDFFAATQFAVSPCNETGVRAAVASAIQPSSLRFSVIRSEYRGATGTGSAIWFYRSCLLGARLDNRTLVSNFCHGPSCPLREWSSCSGGDADALAAAAAEAEASNGTLPSAVAVDIEECAFHGPAGIQPESARAHYWGSRDTAAALAATVGPALRARHGGALVDSLLLWRALGMAYFLRLNLGYDEQFAALSRWERPEIWPPGEKIATFHIRHDDKDQWEGRQIPLQEFMDALFAHHPDVKYVHVCTDDPDIVPKFEKYPNITFLMHENSATDALDRNKKAPIYRDLYTLAMGDVFFGTYSSNYGMMAMDLHLLRTGFCSDLVMMDDWYHIEIERFGHIIWNSTTDMMDMLVTNRPGITWYRDEKLDTDEEYQHRAILATGCRQRRMHLVAGRQLP